MGGEGIAPCVEAEDTRWVGRLPWGITLPAFSGHGRRVAVPQALKRCDAGDSLATVPPVRNAINGSSEGLLRLRRQKRLTDDRCEAETCDLSQTAQALASSPLKR